jgi:hypothetical protein
VDLVTGVGATLAGWWLGAVVLWLIGVRLLGGAGAFAGVRRATAYAQVPGLVELLVHLPGVREPLDSLVTLGSGFWVLWLSVIAVREALGLGTGRAVLCVALPVLVILLGAMLVALLAG